MCADAQFNVINDRKLAQFYAACCTRNSATIEFALQKKFPINGTVKFSATEFLGDTALHLAVKASHSPSKSQFYKSDAIKIFCNIVEQLLFHGADVTITNAATYSAIHVACRTKVDPLIISALFIGHRYNNVTDRNGLSHFHIACTHNQKSLVENYLKDGVSVNSTCDEYFERDTFFGERGLSALHLAVQLSSSDTVKLCMKYQVDVNIKNQKGLNPLRSLNYDPDFKKDTVSAALLSGNYCEDADDVKLFRLFHECQNQDFGELQRAITLQPNIIRACVSDDSPQWPGFTLLHFAANFQMTSVIQFLRRYATLDDMVATTIKKLTPLHCLLKSVINDDKNDRAGRILEIAEFLVSFGSNFDSEDLYGFTPIHYALRRARELKAAQFIQKFLKIIGLPGFHDDDEFNKLCFACLEDDCESLEKLAKNSKLKKCVNETCYAVPQSIKGFTLLHFAILADNERIADILIENEADFCIQSANGLSPLHLAERLNFTWAIKKWNSEWHLTKIVNPVDQDGLSHLHIACRHNAVEVVRSFIEKKIDLNCIITKNIRQNTKYNDCVYTIGDTLLHTSAKNRNPNIVTLLLRNGVDSTLINADDRTPLHLIFDLMKSLTPNDIFLSSMKKLVNLVDNNGLSYFYIACLMGQADIVKEFLYKEPNAIVGDYNWDRETPLHAAVASECLQLVQILVDHGANLSGMNKFGETPLHYALQIPADHEQKSVIIRYLLSKLNVEETKSIDHIGLTLLHIAAMQNDTETAKRLIGRGMDINIAMKLDAACWPGFTSLHLAVWYRCPDVVKLLLDEGADFTVKARNGISPFGFTTQQKDYWFFPENNDWQIIQNAVMKSKRLPEIMDKPFLHYRSIFHIICQTGTVEQFSNEFLELIVDINHPVDYFSEEYPGYTALHFAVDSGSLDLVQTLIKHGADLNAEDAFGMTPVHRACIQSNMELLQLLIFNGAYINGRAIECERYIDCASYRSNNGPYNLVTPIHICALMGNIDIFQFLLKNGADLSSTNAAGKTACSVNSFEDSAVRPILLWHLQTLTFFNFSIPEDGRNFKDITQVDRLELDDLQNECEKLRNDKTTLGDGTTLSELITATPNKMYQFTKQTKLQHILRSDEYNDKYPKCGFILKLQYQKGLAYRALLHETFYSIHRFVECYLPLPELCIWKILENLDEDDLKNLVQTSNRLLLIQP